MNTPRLHHPTTFPLLFLAAAAGFWLCLRAWLHGYLLDLGSLSLPTPRLLAAWQLYALWGTLAWLAAWRWLDQRIGARDWSAWYAQNRRQLLPAAAALIATAALFLRLVVLAGAPLTDDESAHLLQARILLTGHAWLASPPFPEFFHRVFLVDDGRVYSQYFIGWSALMAPALGLHALDLLNPVLCGLSLYPLAGLLERHCRPAAVLGGLICYGSSLLVLIDAATLLPYTACLFFLLWFSHLALRLVDAPAPSPALALAAALCGGAAFFIRPSAALLMCGPAAALLLWSLWRRGSAGERALGAFVAAGAALAVAFLLVNKSLYGGYLRTGYQQFYEFDRQNGFRIFPESAYAFSGRIETVLGSPPVLIGQLASAAGRVATDFFGLPVAVLVPLVLAAGVQRRVWPLALAAALVIVVHCAIGDLGIDTFGPVHLLEAGGALIVLLAAGSQRALDRICGNGARADQALVALFAALALCSWSTWAGLRVLNAGVIAANVAAPLNLAQRTPGELLIFSSRPFVNQHAIDPLSHYVFFMPASAAALGDRVLWANDLGEERDRELAQSMPQRRAFRLGWTEAGRPGLLPLD